MSEEGNIIIEALVIAITAATVAKIMSKISNARLAFTPYDVSMNIIDISLGRYTCKFTHDKGILPLMM